MKLLVIGSGGREHALAWKLAQSERVQCVYVAPGNGGTAAGERLVNVPITDFDALADFCERESVQLTVVGPDAALEAGVVDRFKARGLRIFGPTRAAAEIEWSKAYAKRLMHRLGLPTAAFRTFDDAAAAHDYVERHGAPVVVKADGLAAGKGVVVAQTLEEAHAAIDAMLVERRFGASSARIVVEDFLVGEEASFFALCDGRDFVALESAQDHKRLQDGDLGPNTGGMGAYSPAPVVTPSVRAKIVQRIVQPVLKGLAEEGRPFCGFLFVGLMIDPQGEPRIVEFNARFGDPEAQVILPRLKTDLLPLLLAAADGRLGPDVVLEWDRRCALTVVLASAGYPEAPRKGDAISGVPQDGGFGDELLLFHAGTERAGDGSLRSKGGRVLAVTALGEGVRQAQARAYEACARIAFDGMQYRRDIGHRALRRGG
jgi:phosphoribosylamine--glycine ligase